MNESDIERATIDLLKSQGYRYLAGSEANLYRTSTKDVVLKEILIQAVDRLNPSASEQVRLDAVKKAVSLDPLDLTYANSVFHGMLTSGIQVNYQKDGAERGELISLVDFEHPEENDFLAVNQFVVTTDTSIKRADIVLFVNGLPFAVIELKNPLDASATLEAAWNQLQTYKAEIPLLFVYNAVLAISDGMLARAGSLTADISRFLPWKTPEAASEGQLESLINGLFNPKTILDLIRFFIVFERHKHVDGSGQISVQLIKKIAAYHQYYAVNKAIASTVKASTMKGKDHGRGGVIWHTQGSGKSLSMVFYSAKIARAKEMQNPTILVLTDRNDLDDQLFGTFASASQLLRQEPKQAKNREDLKDLLKTASGGIVFSTIQKFQAEDDTFECLTERTNVVVIADEAHRTQYGFKPRTLIQRSEDTARGVKTVYGFAKYLRDALPNATFLGFTGTPIEGEDINTPAVFGEYIDIYDVSRAIEDGATVPIYYTSRLVKLDITGEGKKLIEEFDGEMDRKEEENPDIIRKRNAGLALLVGNEERLELIAKDIVEHFEERLAVLDGKALVVCLSRPMAAALYKKILSVRPAWHSDDVHTGAIKLIITANSSDGPELSKFHTTKEERSILAERMKNPSDPLKMAVVCDMWLTGFDAPCLHTMYIDKPLKGHTLMQAIARVNRVFGDKPGGLLVDYLGIAADLKQALAFYGNAGGKGDLAQTQEQALNVLKEKIDVLKAMFFTFPYDSYYTSESGAKLDILRRAMDFVLGLENGKDRFFKAVAEAVAAYALSVPLPEALACKDDIDFFQAVKVCFLKLDESVSGDDSGIQKKIVEEKVKQIIDKALVSKGIIDIFSVTGIKRPDISILSDEFLMEVRNIPYKNLALEALKKILADEIQVRSKINFVKSKKLLESLQTALKKYHMKAVTAVEVIEELIALGKELCESDKEAKELGLTEYEYAFYSAIADNQSAMDVMGKDKLRELATVLTYQVKENTTIDWMIKENVRANLRVIIKRVLRKYGYPPDMQKLATEIVVKQAEMLANEIR
ncbi:MAG: type I restriction endonuclease subunit R [Desulfovibrio sp.]|nr:type I restriction endonuclease subunit R [Desulfovibrio sp.]